MRSAAAGISDIFSDPGNVSAHGPEASGSEAGQANAKACPLLTRFGRPDVEIAQRFAPAAEGIFARRLQLPQA